MNNTRIKALAIAVLVGLLAVAAGIGTVLASPAATSPDVLPISEPQEGPADGGIVGTPEALPSRVFVLDNRYVVTQLPPERLSSVHGAPAESSARGGTVRATFTVLPSRLIVVDQDDNIVNIFSNTTGNDSTFYSLRVREGGLHGEEHPLTQEVLSQYNRLLLHVDWSAKGRVYEDV